MAFSTEYYVVLAQIDRHRRLVNWRVINVMLNKVSWDFMGDDKRHFFIH